MVAICADNIIDNSVNNNNNHNNNNNNDDNNNNNERLVLHNVICRGNLRRIVS